MVRFRFACLVCIVISVLLVSTPAGAQKHWAAGTGMAESTPTEAPEPPKAPPPQEPTPAPPPSTAIPATPTRRVPAIKQYLPLLLTDRLSQADHFWADRYQLAPGECTNIHWSVTNVFAVFLNNIPVAGQGTLQVCPVTTATYVLRVIRASGTQEYRVTIIVDAGVRPLIEFGADAYLLVPGQCTTLRWRVTEARAVYLNRQGVPGEGSVMVCPDVTTNYILDAEFANGSTATWRITIAVVPQTTFVMRFWAEQYTLPPGACTTLHWRVQNAREVYLDEEGIPGVGARQVCPAGPQFYTLRAVDLAGQSVFQEIFLVDGNPVLEPSEVIAQGSVNGVAHVPDMDPTQPGDQAGYQLEIESVRVLFAGSPGWAQAAVTLGVSGAFIESGYGTQVDWPIAPGQQVEFRATCDGPNCLLTATPASYLRLRSE